MVLGDIECVKIVVFAFKKRAVDEGESHIEKNPVYFADEAGNRMNVPAGRFLHVFPFYPFGRNSSKADVLEPLYLVEVLAVFHDKFPADDAEFRAPC